MSCSALEAADPVVLAHAAAMIRGDDADLALDDRRRASRLLMTARDELGACPCRYVEAAIAARLTDPTTP